MPDVQEVFRMTTQKIRPEPGFVDRQYDHRRKQQRKRKIGAIAVATAFGVVAVALIFNNMGGQDTTIPLTPTEPTAEEIATGFLGAFGAFDVDQARTFLADDAVIESMSANDDLRLLISWLEATGYQQTLEPCQEVGGSSVGTRVRCAFDFNVLRSDELGLGPHTGSAFVLLVRDGEIAEVGQNWATGDEFSPEVWEPFATWVSTAYPEDAAVMYVDASLSEVWLTEKSIRLWGQRTREYVEDVAPAA